MWQNSKEETYYTMNSYVNLNLTNPIKTSKFFSRVDIIFDITLIFQGKCPFWIRQKLSLRQLLKHHNQSLWTFCRIHFFAFSVGNLKNTSNIKKNVFWVQFLLQLRLKLWMHKIVDFKLKHPKALPDKKFLK